MASGGNKKGSTGAGQSYRGFTAAQNARVARIKANARMKGLPIPTNPSIKLGVKAGKPALVATKSKAKAPTRKTGGSSKKGSTGKSYARTPSRGPIPKSKPKSFKSNIKSPRAASSNLGGGRSGGGRSNAGKARGGGYKSNISSPRR